MSSETRKKLRLSTAHLESRHEISDKKHENLEHVCLFCILRRQSTSNHDSATTAQPPNRMWAVHSLHSQQGHPEPAGRSFRISILFLEQLCQGDPLEPPLLGFADYADA